MKSKAANYFTRKPSNAGARMYLKDPVSGKVTEDYLHVLGLESDSFRAALTAKHKKNLEILALPEDQQEAAKDDAELELFASLVTGWSFEDKLTADAVKELFLEAPQIKTAVDTFAGDRANFITRPSKS